MVHILFLHLTLLSMIIRKAIKRIFKKKSNKIGMRVRIGFLRKKAEVVSFPFNKNLMSMSTAKTIENI